MAFKYFLYDFLFFVFQTLINYFTEKQKIRIIVNIILNRKCPQVI